MEELYFNTNGITLHAWAAGPENGAILLFLHGFPETGYAWKEQLRHFAAQGYRVIAPDQRGYNKSSKPGAIKSYRLNYLVNDIAGLIRQLNNNGVIGVGHDWGGVVLWEVAMLFPELLKKMIIVNMPHPAIMRETLKSNRMQTMKSSYAFFFQFPLLPEWINSAFDYKLMKNTLLKTARPNAFSTDLIREYKLAWRKPGALTAMINWYRAYRYQQKENAIPVSVPTLIIWGKKDPFLLFEMAEKSLALCIKGKLVWIEEATHWIHHEYPMEVNQFIEDFIRS